MGHQEPLPVWERPEPAARPVPPALSRELIVRAAVDLADRQGIGAVSMRRIGALLNAGPMRLYGYVATKEELVDLMVDTVYGEVTAVHTGPTEDSWRAIVKALAQGLRAAVQRHEWTADLLSRRSDADGPHTLAFLERLLSALDSSPAFDDLGAALTAARAINAYVIGAIRIEITELQRERTTATTRLLQVSTGAYLRSATTTGRFPTLAKVASSRAGEPDPDTAFEAGLNYLLDGMTGADASSTPILEWALNGNTTGTPPPAATPRTGQRADGLPQ